MLSPVLIIAAAIAFVVICVANVYILVYFQHEEDKNQAYFPKAVVMLGLLLAEITVLMLPFDVAVSSYGDTHRENMEVLWQIIYMVLAAMLVLVIPFSLFYYEAYDPEDKNKRQSQFCEAIKLEFCTVLVFMLTLVLMWFFLATAYIPYVAYTATPEWDPAPGPYGSINIPPDGRPGSPGGSDQTVEIAVTFTVYTISLISFIGWFFFTLFSSVGMASLPLDMISEYRFRPKKLPLDQFVKEKMAINKRAVELKVGGQKLESSGATKSKSRKNVRKMNAFKKAVYFLEYDWEKLQEKQKGSNPFKYWGYLLLGIVSGVLSLMWFLHVVLFMFLSPDKAIPFLNVMFVDLDSSFAFLGTVLYGAFAFYLMWATIKGNMKIGLRFFFFTIHPMKLGATMMNSFLFNVALILLCSVPIVQFCTLAFAQYAHDTAVENIMGVQITHLKFMRQFFVNNVFLYIMFSLSGLTFIYLLAFPHDSGSQRLKKEKRDNEDAWMIA